MGSKSAKGGPSVFPAKNLVCIRKERKLCQGGVAQRLGFATVTVSKSRGREEQRSQNEHGTKASQGTWQLR